MKTELKQEQSEKDRKIISRRQALKLLGTGAVGLGLAGTMTATQQIGQVHAGHGYVGPIPIPFVTDSYFQTTSTGYVSAGHLTCGFDTSLLSGHTVQMALAVQLAKGSSGDGATSYKVRAAKWDPAGAFVTISDPFIEISTTVFGWERYQSAFVNVPSGVEQFDSLLKTGGGTAKCRGAQLLLRYTS